MEEIKKKIRTIPDFPKKGILFRDVTTLFQDKDGLKQVVNNLVDRYKGRGIDAVAGIEARGFILAGVIANELNTGCILVRKKGKLPYKTNSITYDLEYGTDTLEIHTDAVEPGQKILVIDDLLATGGTSLAAAELITNNGGKIEEIAFVIELPEIGGRKKLEQKGFKTYSIVEFEGE
ncbi:MAG: adenine phosphoribosyltransferase [Flavobacteriales bacterium]|nr:adenine phosphoribosyltransferase [Flavobacteriales bacterium]